MKSLKYSFLVLLFVLILQVKAVRIDPDTEFIVGNETYTVQQTMYFSRIIIDDTYIVFNYTGFYVSSGNAITITLVNIIDDFYYAGDGEKVLEFYASTSSGTVTFSISGFYPGLDYIVKRSGSTIASVTANSSGYIYFENSLWSTRLFEIYQDGEGPSDVTSPEISDVNINFFDPLDTQSSYCWENISCIVTDNVAVDQVFVNITFPGNIKNNFLMSNDSSSTYYFNTSFDRYGNYTYFILATDTSENLASSSLFDFSLPPNWDINNDGVINVFDQVLVSNHYGESGSSGWIREDVDNNGEIEVFDLVLVSNNYGLDWWEG